ncbi:hypothetical protein BAE44_0023963 [Dichanthelium oligosanthes]|uniref:RRM domain-containing protein n=1 Tax=Dichanthelium oligosanthes TaxID=888268 RepID=A0A1E5UQD0_9POAL|nr:hypothetical protein BAE44_0023963 [Dichanthelium oligosanthes]
MAQVSIVTAARRKAAAATEQGDALNPGAREFLPWWRLEGAVNKALSADAPEFVMMAAGQGPAAADAGGSDATPGNVVRPARRAAYRSRRLARWHEAVKRTIFVKYIDPTVSLSKFHESLSRCWLHYLGHMGLVVHVLQQVVDCRICGDPSSGLRFGFVELQREEEAYNALKLDGAIIGISPLRVSRSKTAICPINPKLLPQVNSSNLKAFCEAYFGKVCCIMLLDNDKRSTNLAFIEFTEVRNSLKSSSHSQLFLH